MSYFDDQRIHLSYFDQNEAFASVLPVEGTVVARLSTNTVDDWYRLDLDEPIEYEANSYSYVLIRSRYADQIDDPGGTSVFILISTSNPPNDRGKIAVEDFNRIAWGWARVANYR